MPWTGTSLDFVTLERSRDAAASCCPNSHLSQRSRGYTGRRRRNDLRDAKDSDRRRGEAYADSESSCI